MTERPSLNLDRHLVSEARSVLGTTRVTDTVRRALEEVVRRDRLRRLADEQFADLEDAALRALRANPG